MWRKGRQEGERLDDNKIPRIEEMEKTLQQIEEIMKRNEEEKLRKENQQKEKMDREAEKKKNREKRQERKRKLEENWEMLRWLVGYLEENQKQWDADRGLRQKETNGEIRVEEQRQIISETKPEEKQSVEELSPIRLNN